MADNDHLQFVVHSATKITLRPEARAWAREWKMSDREMAKYLLQQHAQQQEEVGPQPPEPELAREEGFASNVEGAGSQFSGEPSANIEDRRGEPIYGAGLLAKYDAGPAPQAQTWGPNPLANALGFQNVGQRPPPAPQVFGQTQPQWPQQFGQFQYHPLD
jgi:hypothetical protein